mgnify:CR=1 FL=1
MQRSKARIDKALNDMERDAKAAGRRLDRARVQLAEANGSRLDEEDFASNAFWDDDTEITRPVRASRG